MQIPLDFDNFVRIQIDAPYYNDPPPPNGKPGEPYDTVWFDEIVSIIFFILDLVNVFSSTITRLPRLSSYAKTRASMSNWSLGPMESIWFCS